MLIWYVKGALMKSPSSFKIDWEDLDNKTYRSIATGNMIDTVISKKWSKISFAYKCLSTEQVNTILKAINQNPIPAKIINPFFQNGYIEAEFRCSKASAEMLENGEYSLSFNLIQKKKVNGQ